MTISVRMDPLLEKELADAAQRRGMTKSRFVVEAVERALGRKDPLAQMMKLKAEEEAEWRKLGRPFPEQEAYQPAASKSALRLKLRSKHGVGSTG